MYTKETEVTSENTNFLHQLTDKVTWDSSSLTEIIQIFSIDLDVFSHIFIKGKINRGPSQTSKQPAAIVRDDYKGSYILYKVKMLIIITLIYKTFVFIRLLGLSHFLFDYKLIILEIVSCIFLCKGRIVF